MTAAFETGQAERSCPCKVLCPWRFSVAHDVLYPFEVPCPAKVTTCSAVLCPSQVLCPVEVLCPGAPRRSCAHIGQKFFRPASPPSPCLPISIKPSFNKHHHAPVAVIHQRVPRSAPLVRVHVGGQRRLSPCRRPRRARLAGRLRPRRGAPALGSVGVSFQRVLRWRHVSHAQRRPPQREAHAGFHHLGGL